MALFKRTKSDPPVETPVVEVETLPMDPPATVGGLRDFWQHWDYLLGMVDPLTEFGVPVLDAVGLTLNESILAPTDVDAETRRGDVVISEGTRVTPRMLALLIGLGIDKVMARPSPRVVIMPLTQASAPASYLVAAQAKDAGAQAHHVVTALDPTVSVVAAIKEQLVRADLIVTLGGLGEAELDLRSVADQLGPNDFTPVAISPGKDHGFILAEGQIPLLALPGDTYSAFVLTKLIIEPMVAKLMGANTDPELFSAYLAQPLRVTPRMLTCVPATVKDARMSVTGRPTGLVGLKTIYEANALAVLATDDGLVDSDGEAFYLPLR
ncbi:MAG: hypothetical protein LBV06_04965 [Propionibacteriaceae bacterium]|jgi:molybdopterin molybdotransferase|nr:hypothetical protein [Propionibacteriaceae bacterium]